MALNFFFFASFCISSPGFLQCPSRTTYVIYSYVLKIKNSLFSVNRTVDVIDHQN